MNITFRGAKLDDLEAIMLIENASFSKEEASSKKAMKERIDVIGDSFIVAESQKREIVGYIVGPVILERYISDDLFERSLKNKRIGGIQTVLSLAIHPDYRKKGIARQLIENLNEVCQIKKREAISLTCHKELIPFYEKNGFINEGVSASNHGGSVWYNLVRNIKK